jgi:choline kinase
MAYNYYPNYYQQMPLQQPQMPQNQSQQMQSGFVSVRNEAEARNYPVAYGNSVTMKDENSPYIYTKTMGFSQLDRPIFDKYKLVKEETEEQHQETVTKSEELEKIQGDIKALWNEINEMKASEKYGA